MGIMKITYFAKTRELMGRDSDSVDFPTDIHTIDDVIQYLSAKGAPYDVAFEERNSLRFALDNELAQNDASINNISELAIFPPVTGG